MPELVLVRHGQAAFAGTDYDRLTELGVTQSRWLGEYFAERGMSFDAAYTGRQRRHRETFEALAGVLPGTPPAEQVEGFDEYDFAGLIAAYAGPRALADLRGGNGALSDVYTLLRGTLVAWSGDRLNGHVAESWADFGARVLTALGRIRAATRGARRVLVVCSGGPIARALGLTLQLPDSTTIGLNLQLRNSAICQLYEDADGPQLAAFNGVPHLDRADRWDALTYI